MKSSSALAWKPQALSAIGDRITAAFSSSFLLARAGAWYAAASRSRLLNWWANGLGLSGRLANWSANLDSMFLLDRFRASRIFSLALNRPLLVSSLGMSSAIVMNCLCHLGLRGWIPFWELKSVVLGLGIWLAWLDQRREGWIKEGTAAAVLALFAGLLGMLMFSGRYDSLAALAVMGWLALAAWHKPQLGLWLFLLLLPLHHLLMTFLTEQIGLSPVADKLIRAWKDMLLVVLAVKAGWIWLTGQAKLRLGWIDVIFTVFIAINFMAFYQTQPIADAHAALYSLRYNLYFIVCFYLGRIVKISPDQLKRFFLALLILGTTACLVGVAEKGWVLSDVLLHLGYPDYLRHSFNSIFPTPNGLPYTFWLEGYMVRRLGSFFLGPIDFAYAMLLVLPAAGYWCAQAKQARSTAWRMLVFSFLMSAFLLAFTRAAIFSAGVELLLMAWFLHRRHLRLGWQLLGLAAVLALLAFSTHELSQWLFSTATFQEASAQGHLGEWKKSVDIIQQQITGAGLGSAGFVGKRFQGSVGGENQYLILGREIGIIGMGFFILVHGIALLAMISAMVKNQAEMIQWGAVIALSAVASIMILGMTSQVYINYFLVFITWWLVGWIYQNSAGFGTAPEARGLPAT